MNLIKPDWPAPPQVVAFATTRASGDAARPAELAGFAAPRVRQVHGTLVVTADSQAEGIEADGVFTRDVGVVCRVETADCLPVLLCNRRGTEVAAVHAGWRGLVAGILEVAVTSMLSPPEELLAWIGPGISQPCYQVGGDLREAFLAAAATDQQHTVAACFAPDGEKYLADLVGLAQVRLEACGVTALYGGELCTFSDPVRFHSWRRDGKAAGRMVSGLALVPPDTQSHT